ncbi:N-acetyl-gamma-glutamyl-phosphate reductase [Nodularia spumigena CS-584]|jgi:N-acetyl-gamma-glutamyl-phosphate reductase|uniref:N-acetyl-gamma-glutamyl-phosphate reductase n=1 Tax=Nodularia spumigena UHCC 0060 TaxID=3110300 RepID=A0ABU5URQ8_NODSP|nr:N-acetyl-gamma-glutamyl-phosphate reductase [Nodularia spumigena]EAW45846.1 N-acetyl-gamma-glutamyl-phosphate reductase [Nodularia spumigena CCY9414]MDB9382904.1 N-acetyl-gamma-glutamyl-phosphate reductase [Nodularia spumigena CS-584]MEA5527102.1 N-acetyl-gamma-glutamyl-phosphate reductase [Nodularia spumigena UHCC 0143]MEA5558416.1 N-acetyl-gamma-glutamyl-phosphate reductase [Nodularia spumigena CH309]MEA5608960.1 N-acetyl-gamma-glutamyl-phosphate reductase [Nodularia spumigena UHCC 0060]
MGNFRRVPVGIVGASGYGGVQLIRLLMEHPEVELVYLGGESSAGKSFGDLYPHLAHLVNLPIEAVDAEVIAHRCEVVFLSLPNGLACQIAPILCEKGCKVLDLSADYRFSDLTTYTNWYGTQRSDRTTAATAVYGLPELYRDRIAEAQLVGCPGCYPTASLLALSPLLKQGLIVPETAIIDAKSGTSGGGRQGKINLLLAEADNSLGAYGVARHRHTPEIEQICSDLAGHEVTIQFTPHLIPMVRGILATVYATLRDPGLVRDDLITIYSAFYRNAPWVRICNSGIYPQTKWACGSNLCYIGVEVDPRTGRVIVMSAIDNLIKGQAGQAIQCLNLMMGWDETLGLPKVGFYP